MYLFLTSKNSSNEHYLCLCDHGVSMANKRNWVVLMITEDPQEQEKCFRKTNEELEVFHFISILNNDKFLRAWVPLGCSALNITTHS